MDRYTIMAISRARYDYRCGEGRDSNPFIKGTKTHKAWSNEMNELINLENERSHAQGLAESQLAESIDG